ncbi:hypothetical protein [Pedomonas sp. V897]|uniref:hypothetical protein n=1 Tax=Pedomonas sp. V897 TaxID=3446482 RepID=UPI003EE05F5A
MLVGIGGADFSLSPGEETELFSEADAKALIASGQAVPVGIESPGSGGGNSDVAAAGAEESVQASEQKDVPAVEPKAKKSSKKVAA